MCAKIMPSRTSAMNVKNQLLRPISLRRYEEFEVPRSTVRKMDESIHNSANISRTGSPSKFMPWSEDMKRNPNATGLKKQVKY